MKSNILAFTGPLSTRAASVSEAVRDNVVSMNSWKKAARPRRTPQGVFFISNVLCTSGDAA
ncbi:hypothetical protein [Aliiroseovarius subalbicans]|uniref:hypothetical protein n=1 Tax=Aliiroseovarius subalbicans TaxID=2925840 RepID=UPI001F55B69A|nr:hypothetical protein [Aliiroseovarius subalbicans]MCI2399243.1 hypothetical protein [Aliiroseovarius subalbicans]